MATYSEYLDSKPLPKRGWRRIRRHLPRLSVLLMTLLLIAVVLWPYVVVSVPTGQVGILWYRLIGFDPYCMCLVRGTVLDPRDIREEGLHLIMPWNKIYLYDLRLQSIDADIQRHFQGRREHVRSSQYSISTAA